MAADVPSFKLNNGVEMPSVGLGCWMGEPGGGQRVCDMCVKAIKAGYRHFDTADGYQNEKEVGRALRDSGLSRKEFFVTTKLKGGNHHRVKEAFQASLDALDLEYIDLFLMHWPQATVDGRTLAPDESPTIHDTWAAMVALLDTKKVRAIGVSNFGAPLLESLVAKTSLVPAVNQVELHPCLPQRRIRETCAKHGILVTAYSPLGQPAPGVQSPLLTDETIVEIADKRGVDVGQVILSWMVQHGIVVVPKSENPERIKKNITLIQLTDEEVQAVDSIHKKEGKHRSLLDYHKEDGTVFTWTYEQLGWDLAPKGMGKALDV